MSAILAVRKQGSIELLTDSAAICGGTGKVLYFGKKQVATAIPACAIGATGAVRTCFEFERLLTGISAFDSLIERAADTAPAVGGAIHHTTVTRDGTSTVVVHRWPDRVGEKIRDTEIAPRRAPARVAVTRGA